jgi:molybdate transport system permease protein
MEFLKLTPLELEALRLSLWISGWAVLGSLGPGILMAWVLARKQFPGKALVDGLVHLPLVLPPVVTGYMLLLLMGRRGMVGGWLYDLTGLTFAFNWKGAALASAVMAFPLLVRAVRLSIEGVDQGLEQAARTLGAGPLDLFFTVTLPLIFPGILTGIILAFARSLSEFGATITFVSNIPGETRTLPLALYTLTQMSDGEAGALRLCLISVVVALVALVTSDLLARRMNRRMKGEN